MGSVILLVLQTAFFSPGFRCYLGLKYSSLSLFLPSDLPHFHFKEDLSIKSTSLSLAFVPSDPSARHTTRPAPVTQVESLLHSPALVTKVSVLKTRAAEL